MELVLSLITQKLRTMAEAGDYHLLQSKYKAISALLLYAVWQERDGKPEVLDAFLCAARASKWREFTWYPIGRFSSTQLSEASPRAIILATPYILHLVNKGDLFQHWEVATSTIPHTEEVAQNEVDALLQFAYEGDLMPHITVDMWSWLRTRPSLPPVCQGRELGTDMDIVKAIQGLKDIEVLKSYLLMVWSEWGPLWEEGFNEICASICGDFGEVGIGHHRADLIQRLDHILGELDRGLEYLQQYNPDLNRGHVWKMEHQYGNLMNILLEMNVRAISCMSDPTALLCTLTYGCIQDPMQHLCVHSLSHVHSLPSGNLCLAPLPCSSTCTQASISMDIHTHLIMPPLFMLI